ncbi:MAG TPA: hypothetical protein VJY99_12050 [Buttiauxella sp.]|uniref:hypothetical protein n=1 Tax=Buttiauxella sp. TaxID=1972222 RepID=UPI002B4760D6|nr:hypothetical protein [Buttiauxella sp.]HKM97407.1 hypothetical protein [Buttiauxella sp.]
MDDAQNAPENGREKSEICWLNADTDLLQPFSPQRLARDDVSLNTLIALMIKLFPNLPAPKIMDYAHARNGVSAAVAFS